MGWLFLQGAERRDIVNELTREHTNDQGEVVLRTLKHCCRGNVMYAVHETVASGSPLRFIGVHLMQRSDDGWGYKEMEEAMGPCYYDCPLSYFELAGDPRNEVAKEWREKVRRMAAKKAEQNAKKPKVGEIWSCLGRNCKRIRIAFVKGRRIEAYNLTGSGYYRIPKKILGEKLADAGGSVPEEHKR